MKNWILALLAVSSASHVLAQPSAERYVQSISAADLKSHLAVIADAAMEGRETATEGQRRAAAYIESRFRSMGLTPGNLDSFQQHFPLVEDTIISTLLKINGREYAFGTDYTMTPRLNSSRSVDARKVVFAGYGISDSAYTDYRDIDVRDAIVVITWGEPRSGNQYLISGSRQASAWTYSLTSKIEEAYNRGAAGIFILDPAIGSGDARPSAISRKTQVYLPRKQPQDSTSLNVAGISGRVFSDIFGKQQTQKVLQVLANTGSFKGLYKTAEMAVACRYQEATQQKASSSNVIGVVEGTDKKDEYVLVTAHYDHLGKKGGVIFYGADDDGSGTASVLELAEAFALAKAEGRGPRRSMVFMTVSGEEKGLWGSAYYADNPLFPLEKTTADLNIDMVGRIDPKRQYGDSLNYVYVIGESRVSSDLKTISDSANRISGNLELDPKYDDPKDPERIFYRSDHYNFASKGVPILFYFNGTHADYHRSTDTIDKINFSLMEKRVRLIFNTAWQIANREEMLKRDIPL